MDGMKTGTIALGNASVHIGYSQIVPPNKRGLARELTEFFVPESQRGNGEGTSLFADVCAQADNAGIMLILIADTYRLAAFYSRHGFQMIDPDSHLMIRKVIAPQRATTAP